jgi:hypothetical protein
MFRERHGDKRGSFLAFLGLLLAVGCGLCGASPPPPTVTSAQAAEHRFADVEGPNRSAGGATDLLFRDFYRMPVGPRGLEPTDKLLRLNGQPVRIRGYMAHQELPMAGLFVLSPLPVSMGDEDDSLADDLPPSVVFVHLDGQSPRPVPHVPGIVQVTGVLSLGPREEADGHVSHVRLLVDTAQPDALLKFPSPSSQARR